MQTMRAAAIDPFGGPEVLSIHSLPVPVPDAREVLIAVDTAGVASWDADMREGWSPTGHTRFPLVLGTDGGGTVAALGSRVRRFKVGDRVYAYSFDNPKGGFYAEYVAVLAENIAHIPKRLDVERAGAIPCTGLTALQGIDDALRVRVREFQRLGRAVEAAKLEVPIAGAYALADAAKAHERLAAGHVLGKIVLRTR